MTKRQTVTQGYIHEVDDLQMLGGQDQAPVPPVQANSITADERERWRRLSLPVSVDSK
jgi:hypothetical protein